MALFMVLAKSGRSLLMGVGQIWAPLKIIPAPNPVMVFEQSLM